MKKKKRKKISTLILLLAITIGYALLSTTLKINGIAGIKNNTWDIHWDEESISITENSIQAENPIVSDDKKTVSYAIELELPGDFFEFTIDAVNAGTIDGMISVDGIQSVVKDKDGEPTTLPNYIKYSVTYADGTEILQYQKLAKRKDENTPTREKYKVRIEYDSESTTLPDTNLTYKIETNIPYQQADSNVVEKEKPVGIANLTTGPKVSTILWSLNDINGNNEYGGVYDAESITRATKEQYEQVKDALTENNNIALSTANLSIKTTNSSYNYDNTGNSLSKIRIDNVTGGNTIYSSATNFAISPDSEDAEPVYVWYDASSKTIYYYTRAKKIYLNSDSSNMFWGFRSLKSIDLDDFDTSNVTNMQNMFRIVGSFVELDLSNFDTSKVTNMNSMFFCANIKSLDLSNFNTSNVTNMDSMFAGLYTADYENDSNDNEYNLDIRHFDTSKVTSMQKMFYEATLGDVDISNWNTSNVTNMYEIFNAFKVNRLNISGWDFSSLSEETEGLDFYEIDYLDISNWTNVPDYMFAGEEYNRFDMYYVNNLNLSGWDFSNIPRVWDNTKYSLLNYFGAGGLDSVNISHSIFPSDSSEFLYSYSDDTIFIGLETIDTSKVENMSGMLKEINNEGTIDLSNWDVSKVKNMSNLFDRTKLSTIDISGWDVSNVENMQNMFNENNNLTTIYASNNFSIPQSSNTNNMFYYCENLVGGNGTHYSNSYRDGTYARIDTTNTPGYFTEKIRNNSLQNSISGVARKIINSI